MRNIFTFCASLVSLSFDEQYRPRNVESLSTFFSSRFRTEIKMISNSRLAKLINTNMIRTLFFLIDRVRSVNVVVSKTHLSLSLPYMKYSSGEKKHEFNVNAWTKEITPFSSDCLLNAFYSEVSCWIAIASHMKILSI